mgnify:FL=1
MNDLVKHESWIKRNRLWVFPSIGIFIILMGILFSAGVGGKVADITKAYADSKLYDDAILEVEKNKDAINALGDIKPIDNMAIIEGFVNYSEDNKAVKTTVRIKGSKGNGKLDILAEKVQNSWDYNEIKIRIKGSKEPIIIIKN